MRRIRFDLYSAGHLNTPPQADGTGRRTPKTGRIGRDTPRLYSVYSVVFSSHLHTNSAPQPYSRKGFQICIQCIQRIPTPFVFGFFPFLEPEYMNTLNTIHHDLTKTPRLGCDGIGTIRARRIRPRICIQRPS